MSDKDLLVRIDAQTTGYERSIARAEAQTHSFEYALRRANAEAKQQEAAMLAQTQATQRLANGMLIAGGVMAAGLGFATKAAIDWEAQWTAVEKVLDGTPEQLAAVEQGIRDLATELPTSHAELAELAAVAGQLGIEAPNVVEFTRVVSELGVTTNLVGAEGATTLARFLNIMGTSQSEISNVASTLVDLGNNAAATEAEIAALGLRIAAAGKNVGLSEGEVLGLSAAMTELGIRAESGGTAISLTFQMLDKAVKSGGSSLEQFADIAGVSVESFKALYGEDAAGALSKFLEGLGRIKDEGGNLYQVLNDLGISGQRQIAVLTALANGSEGLSEQLARGSDAYRENIALTEEFAKFNATSQAALDRARSSAQEFAIQLGENLLPIVGRIAEVGSGFLDFLNGLPQPLKEIGTWATVAVSGLLLFGGAALKVQKYLTTLRTTMTNLNATGDGMSKAFIAGRVGAGLLGAALIGLSSQVDDSNTALKGMLNTAGAAALGFSVGGPWGAAIGGAIGLLTTFAQSNAAAAEKVRILTESLDENTGAITGATDALVGKELLDSGALELAEKLGVDLALVKEAALGSADALAEVKEQASTPPEGVVRLGADLNADIDELTDKITDQSGAIGEARNNWRLLSDAEGDSAGASDDAAAGLGLVGGAASDAENKVDALAESFKDLNATLSNRSAARDYEAAIDAATKALKENGKTLNINTEAGRDNQAALDAIAQSAMDHANAVYEDTGNLRAGRKVLQGARDDLYEQARAFGMSKAQARAYVDQVLKIPTEWKTEATLDTSKARTAADLLAAYVESKKPAMEVALLYRARTGGRAADGGLVEGPGGPRDDAAGLYALSNREYVQPAAAVEYYGVSFMEAVRQRAIPRMADGGTPGGGGGGAETPLLTLARLLRMVARPEDTVTLREVNQLARARDRARDRLEKARKAEKDVTDQREALTEATNKWRDAQKGLLAQTKALTATASAQGDAFGGEGTSLTAQGLLAKKRAAGTAAREFEVYLRVLRRKHLDADLLAELQAEGPTSDGLALAESLANAPIRQLRQINRADDRLDRNARGVATFGIHGSASTRDRQLVQQFIFKGPVHGNPRKFAHEAGKQQRKALAIARLG